MATLLALFAVGAAPDAETSTPTGAGAELVHQVLECILDESGQ